MSMEKRMNLIEKLQRKENFTSAESSLADYILNNIDNVYRMSLQDLAKASYVSKPSVIRLYRKVGCSNYREFSIGLQLEKIKTDNPDTIENSKVFMESEDLYDYIQKVGVLCKQIVDNCIHSIDKDSIEDIVTTLYEAKNIYLYSIGDIEHELGFFMSRMAQIDKKPILVKENKDPKALIASMNEKDAVLIVSIKGPDSEDELLDQICERPCTHILVTTADNEELDLKTDYSFYTYPKGNDFIRNSVIVSQMSLLLGLNIIQACLIKERFNKKND